MGLLEIILIGISLSMDAFAVSLCMGLSIKKSRFISYLIPGLYFGTFQALMPLLGYFAGTLFAQYISHLDHWIAFALLSFIGTKMIVDGIKNKEEEHKEHNFSFLKMCMLSLATSIDALAVGITMSFFEVNIFFAIMIIGITTFVLSTAGVISGRACSSKLKAGAEIFGGAVLIILGVKILIEHLVIYR